MRKMKAIAGLVMGDMILMMVAVGLGTLIVLLTNNMEAVAEVVNVFLLSSL